GGGAAAAACGNRSVAELVTLRPFAGWPERSPARLVATATITINDAAASILTRRPVPQNTSEHQRSNIASSFDPGCPSSPDRLQVLRSERPWSAIPTA